MATAGQTATAWVRGAAMGLGAAELAAAKAEQDAIFATADERDALIAELDGLATRRTRQPRRHDTPTPVLSQAAPVL